MNNYEIIDLILSGSSFLSTVAIAVVLHRINIKNTALAALNDFKNNIKELDYRLTQKLGSGKLNMNTIQVADAADGNKTTSDIVALLNEYEGLALGVRSGLLSEKIIKKARMDGLIFTHSYYKVFIDNWREGQGTRNAWQELEELAIKWKESLPFKSRI